MPETNDPSEVSDPSDPGDANEQNDSTEPKRGMALINALKRQCLELKTTPDEVADQLGYHPRYMSILMRGQRWIGSVGHEKLKLLANFLDIPLVTVYVMAGILDPKDFVHHSTLASTLEVGYKNLSQSKVMAAHVPTRDVWEQTPDEVKLLCILLYERFETDDLYQRTLPQSSLPGFGPVLSSTWSKPSPMAE